MEDLELRRQHAFDVAWRSLGHRDRTEAEIVGAFLKARVEPELAEEVLGELREGGYVDDAQFARRFVEDRRRLDDWGSDRIERRLSALGVAREHVQAALGEGGHDELEAAGADIVEIGVPFSDPLVDGGRGDLPDVHQQERRHRRATPRSRR